MQATHKSQIISVEGDFFMTFFKACGSLWQIAYDKMWMAREGESAIAKIGANEYKVTVESVDEAGQKVMPDKEAKFIRFAITSPNGNADEMAQLEQRLIERLAEIQQGKREWFAPSPGCIVDDKKGCC
jgi:hypothetical protein